METYFDLVESRVSWFVLHTNLPLSQPDGGNDWRGLWFRSCCQTDKQPQSNTAKRRGDCLRL